MVSSVISLFVSQSINISISSTLVYTDCEAQFSSCVLSVDQMPHRVNISSNISTQVVCHCFGVGF